MVKTDELNSFTKASRVCGVSQSALSIQIKKVEEKLGLQIFERDRNTLLTTKNGEIIVQRARNIVEEYEKMLQFATNSQDVFAGDFRLGGFPTLAPYYFYKIVRKITRNFEKLDLMLEEQRSAELVKNLEAGEIDAAFLTMPVKSKELTGRKIFCEPFYLGVPEDHRLACTQSVSLKSLYGEKVILLDEEHCLRDLMLEICRIAGAFESGSFQAASLEILRQMVRIGSGIAFFPEIAVRKNDGLTYIRIEDAPRREIGLFWRESYYRDELMEKICKVLV